MYLKSIKAYGFKSFADKIEINLGKNINGIVGPNGSGKSNIVDAVRWVLGEQSLKSLRGEAATDIIFSGSKSRKSLNSASVTLVFDNSDLYLPINYTEVSVKRVMYRSGENEYYLNNERCRLKDITTLLTDTGADKESFNIISQGKIDEILSTKAADRRLIFESAAGVIKYKKRKEEATKKLERTNANIARVNDILKEIENNLLPLEKQSQDAKIFLEHKTELTDLEISLMAHDIHQLNYTTKELKEKIETLKDELIQLSNSNSTYDIDLLTKKDEVKRLEEEINKQQTILLEITKSIEKIDADIRLLKERKKYSATNNPSAQNILNLKEELLKTETVINELTNSGAMINTEITNLETNLNNQTKTYDDLIKEKEKLSQKLETIDRNITNTNYKIQLLETNIAKENSLPSAIKNILNNNRLSGVHHVIGKLIEVDTKYKLAINTSLGGANNYLVVDTSSVAKELVNYLKENGLGRATFYPIDTIKPRSIDDITLMQLQKVEGFISVAASLVETKPIYQDIIKNQLGNVIVATNLESATNISKITLKKYKIVTLDGQLVNVGGSITGGSAIQTNNLLKEKYDLETAKIEAEQLITSKEETETKLTTLNSDITTKNNNILKLKSNILELRSSYDQKLKVKAEYEKQRADLNRELKDIDIINTNNSDHELENMMNMYYSAISSKDNVTAEIEKLKSRKATTEQNIQEIEELSKRDTAYINNKEKNLKELEIKLNTANIKLDNLLISLGEEYNITYEAAISKYKLEHPEDQARSRVRELKNIIKNIGYVNVDAIEEYEKVKTRYEFLTTQKDDLVKAEDTLLEIIKEMDEIMKTKFLTTFEAIRKEFKQVFVSMFRGGEAELVLTDPDNLLETGVEIQAVPSGKNLKSISLLSGGEKTFTAISLLFAILNIRPVPFCLLDEVEAALDDANVESFGNYLYKYRDKTQFILITHKKKTMEFADILYGITMQESGVSKLVSVKLDEVKK